MTYICKVRVLKLPTKQMLASLSPSMSLVAVITTKNAAGSTWGLKLELPDDLEARASTYLSGGHFPRTFLDFLMKRRISLPKLQDGRT